MSWLREANAEPLPGYRLIEPLGSGGFGEVWKCEAPGGLNKAIKFVYGNLNSLESDGVRAEQEWKAMQRIKEVRHPFVCSVERLDFVDGELIIVMELAERTLHDMHQECQSSGLIGIPGDDLFRYLRDAAEALDFMNEKHNLQHLDVKPRNLFLVGDRVKVADFGLVKHLERQSASGVLGGVTPMYAPPETFLGKISPHSDQYSLAIVYQEMLTGQRPFNAKNIRQMAQQHLQGEPDLRSLPEAERPSIARALAKDPNDRFPSCMAFVAALYRARVIGRVLEPAQRGGARPKPMSDTMEDLFLDGFDPAPVNGGASVSAPPAPPKSNPNIDVSDLGVTVMQPDHGALRPSLIIGLGAFGRKAILELRCRFLDRFGDLSKLPVLRFLYLDSDPDANKQALVGAPEIALTRNEIFALPLQPVGNYRRRSLDHLAEWLPREKLYSMPRSLQTQGSRALGRLAFADNQQRLLARLRREIQEITNPDSIYQAVARTGLALSNNTPRVYVLGAAGGGGSGLLPDLGYGLRRLLANLRHAEAPVTTFLLCGAPQDPATPKPELANVYATLTELNHFSDSLIPFAAQYGIDGQRLIDHGAPFHSVYLLPLAHRTPDDLKTAVAHLGNYLFHEITTPLGRRLEELRQADQQGDPSVSAPSSSSVPLRTFGTYSVWFPRGLLLQQAARQACLRLLESWTASEDLALAEEVHTAIGALAQKYALHPDLAPESLARQFESGTQAGGPTDHGNSPGEVLAGILAKLEEQLMQPLAQEDPANWGKQALSRVRDWMGGLGDGEQDLGDWRKTKLARVLSATSLKIAEQWEQHLAQEIFALMQFPGARVAGAEAALERVRQTLVSAAETQGPAVAQATARVLQAWKQLETALEECAAGGGFRLFGGRSRTRQLRHFLDALAHFARLRLGEELAAACRACLLNLSGRLSERNRDLGFCRQRLRHLKELLEHGPGDPHEELTATRPGADFTLSRSPLPSTEAYWELIRHSSTARVILPEGQDDLEKAALRFLQSLPPEDWPQLDKELYEQVLQPQGGLHGACISGDLTRQIATPLLEAASTYLGQRLPVMDVAQILKSEAENGAAGGLQEQLRDYLERAAPRLAGKDAKQQTEMLLLPASPAGKALGEALTEFFPEVKLVRVPGQADLMFLREHGGIGAADLEPLLRISRAAYSDAATTPATSPHARFDISDWLPLDP
jgi:eukaryotic-like serine/threonine-protein kinase